MTVDSNAEMAVDTAELVDSVAEVGGLVLEAVLEAVETGIVPLAAIAVTTTPQATSGRLDRKLRMDCRVSMKTRTAVALNWPYGVSPTPVLEQ